MRHHLAQLRAFIAAHFDLNELRTLCFDLGVPHDELPVGGISAQAGELLLWLGRRRQLERLLTALRQARPTPFADLNLNPDDPTSIQALYAELPAPLAAQASVEAAGAAGANPFYAAGRINDPAHFYGRERLLREIRAELGKRCSVSLVGDSQMGKSSLLYYLYATRANWLPDPAVSLAYVDLQSVLDEADFCETILEKLGAAGDTPRALKRALASRQVILLLDEMERLAEADFSPRLHDLLRSLAQEPHFAMCLATQRPLVQVFPARTAGGVSPFHNVFVIKHLGPFTPAEARGFVAARLAAAGLRFTDAEVERLLAESSGHPARLQRLAKALFAEKDG